MTAPSKRRAAALLAVAALAAGLWGWGASHAAADDDVPAASATKPPARAGQDAGDDAAPSRVTRVGGANAVRLSGEEQKQTGLQVLRLQASTHRSESLAAGRVLEIAPLLELRTAYGEARGELAMARAAATASSLEAKRLRTLHRDDGNISTRELEQADARAAADQAHVAAARRKLDDIAARATQQWGARLAAMALQDGSGLFARLLDQREVLLLVTLRRDETLPQAVHSIQAGPTGDRRGARRAMLISAAPGTDPVSQGETYYFHCDAQRLRTGMRLDAWIPRPGKPRQGVEVPGSAVLWYANRLWVYVRSGNDLFVRRPLTQYEETADGWFVSEGVDAGEQVVVRGGQMLLSEEFRAVIPSEDDAK